MNSDLILMLLIGIMAINHFIIRTKQWHQKMWLFWACQLCNVLFGSFMLLWGIPEFKDVLEVINILVGLLFLYHAVQNHLILQRHLRNQKEEQRINENE